MTAGHGGPAEAAEAVAGLCRVYWYSLYAYARMAGHSVQDAEDLTQGFFMHLIESRLLASADAARGRFRTFLLCCFRNYMASERKRAGSKKRGGDWLAVPMDRAEAEKRLERGLVANCDPERQYERNWAVAILEDAMSALKRQFHESGREPVFEALRPLLERDEGAQPYAVVADELGTTPGSVKSMVHRLRQRYREALRAAVLRTVDSSAEVDDELRHLLHVLQS